jgi:hypothetical protein
MEEWWAYIGGGEGGGVRMRRSLGQAGATHMVFEVLLSRGLLFKVLYSIRQKICLRRRCITMTSREGIFNLVSLS